MPLVVDLCGTLIREDTTRGLIARLSPRGWRSILVRAGNWPFLWRVCRVCGVDLARAFVVLSLRGLSKSALDEAAQKYVDWALETQADPRVLEAVRSSLDEGLSVYLATATLDPIAEAVVRRLGLSGVVTSRLEYDNSGRCTGRLALDVTGKKWTVLQDLLPEIADEKITLYTDNAEDTDLMAHASKTYFTGRPGRRLQLLLSEFPNVCLLED